MTRTAYVALVGDRSPHVQSHLRLPAVLEALRRQQGIAIDAYWVRTDDALTTAFDGFDGIWILPGSPYRSEAGALHAARVARTSGLPLLGTCGGFQHIMLEFARNACGLTGAGHAENTPDAEDFLVVPLACSLAGHEGAVNLRPGSAAERIFGVERTMERYHCAYGLNPAHLGLLESHGMRFTGHDDAGEVRVAELDSHPFLLATLFQPELAELGGRPHPVIAAFADATVSFR
jgi:CTP synthase (UTP-ammonia lyase)